MEYMPRPRALNAASLAECQRITDAAIDIFKTERVPKRGLRRHGDTYRPGEPPHPSLVRARQLFAKASKIACFSAPATSYNRGVCFYHFDLFQSGHMNIDIAVAISQSILNFRTQGE